MFSSLNIDPVRYVENKETNITIGLDTLPAAKVENIDGKLLVRTRRFSSRDRSELSTMDEEITLDQLNEERAFIVLYLKDLDELITDVTNADK